MSNESDQSSCRSSDEDKCHALCKFNNIRNRGANHLDERLWLPQDPTHPRVLDAQDEARAPDALIVPITDKCHHDTLRVGTRRNRHCSNPAPIERDEAQQSAPQATDTMPVPEKRRVRLQRGRGDGDGVPYEGARSVASDALPDRGYHADAACQRLRIACSMDHWSRRSTLPRVRASTL